jgi:TolB-like protein
MTNRPTLMSGNPNRLIRFWQELKRRRVVHVIIVYATAAFVLIELVGNVYETLKLPDWTPALTLIILVIGFPLAIIFSWIFDVTPEGIEKTKPSRELHQSEVTSTPNSWRIATYVSGVIIVGLLALNIFGGKKRVKIDESLEKSIAVIPFQNFSVDSGQEPMCLGLTDEIINHLFKIESFDKVSSLNSVMTYIGSEKKTPEIADELAVNYILEGTYKKIGDQIRVTAQLIEARTDTHLWQHEYDRPYEEIIAIQADIALQIADHIRVFISGSEKQRIQKVPTTNPKAYETLKKAIYLIVTEGFTQIPQALDIVLEVIRADPEYADAYAALGHLTLWLGTYAGQTEIQYAALDAIQYFDKALELDPNNASAHMGNGNVHEWARWDYVEAEKEYLKAIELEPNNPLVYQWPAEFYVKMEQLESLWEIIDKSSEKDLLFKSVWHGSILSGNNQEAYTSLIIASGEVMQCRWIGESYIWLGEYDSAKFYLEYAMKNEHPDMLSPRLQADLAIAYEKTNHLQQARTIINQLIAKSDTTSVGSPGYFTGWYYSWMGDKDSAFYWLEKAYENRSPEFPWLKVDPAFNSLKDDPRYWDLYERTGHKAYDDYMASRKN